MLGMNWVTHYLVTCTQRDWYFSWSGNGLWLKIVKIFCFTKRKKQTDFLKHCGPMQQPARIWNFSSIRISILHFLYWYINYKVVLSYKDTLKHKIVNVGLIPETKYLFKFFLILFLLCSCISVRGADILICKFLSNRCPLGPFLTRRTAPTYVKLPRTDYWAQPINAVALTRQRTERKIKSNVTKQKICVFDILLLITDCGVAYLCVK